jgi:hypothetical protein
MGSKRGVTKCESRSLGGIAEMKIDHCGPRIVKHRTRAKNRVVKFAALMLLFASGVFTPAQLLSATHSKTRAQVVSQLPLHGSPVVSMFMEREHGRTYLYLQHGGSEELTAVDITNLKVPRVVERRPTPKRAAAPPANKLGEYSALEAVEQDEVRPAAPLPAVAPKTVRLVDVTDPDRPIIGQIFANVTAMLGDPDYRRIFIASTDTLYILKEREKGACEAPADPACSGG